MLYSRMLHVFGRLTNLAVSLGCARNEQAMTGVEYADSPSAEVPGIKRHDSFVMTTRPPAGK